MRLGWTQSAWFDQKKEKSNGLMNYSAASHGVSINDNFYLNPNAAPNNGIYATLQQAAGNLTRQISQHLSHTHCNLCNLWIKNDFFVL
ncbi:MAG: hypothetical protein BBJ60_11760 [Desulfobacterales bacterium S7086C20]|nr:MAG: hypothetical protein BBJ60_11760 [Desulfobacterales bacterium S7086C20]